MDEGLDDSHHHLLLDTNLSMTWISLWIHFPPFLFMQSVEGWLEKGKFISLCFHPPLKIYLSCFCMQGVMVCFWLWWLMQLLCFSNMVCSGCLSVTDAGGIGSGRGPGAGMEAACRGDAGAWYLYCWFVDWLIIVFNEMRNVQQWYSLHWLTLWFMFDVLTCSIVCRQHLILISLLFDNCSGRSWAKSQYTGTAEQCHANQFVSCRGVSHDSQ